MAVTVHSIIRTLSRLVVFGITGLTFVCAVAVLLTQLDFFRSWALNKGLDALNGELQGKIEIGGVSGNLITGLTLYDVRLLADGTTVVTAPEVELQYSIAPIFESQTIYADVVVHKPTVRLIRNRVDSVWNFARITKPSTDSIKTPFNWTIDVSTLEMNDATFLLHDMTAEERPESDSKIVDYSNLQLQHVNLAAQAHIAPTQQSVWIQNLDFTVPKPDIRVVELSGRFAVDTTGLTVDRLYLQTERTLLTLSGHIDSLNVLGDEPMLDIESYPISLDLDADRISAEELKRFVPAVAFLGGTPALELKASGGFNDLKIDRLLLELVNSKVDISGRLRNLTNPDSLTIDAKIANSTLSHRDVDIYVPGLGLPDLSYVGTATIRSAVFSGPPMNFLASIDATTAVGAVNGGLALDLRNPVMKYTADVALVHGNLGPIMKDSAFRSDFTGRAVLNGQGITLDELDTRVRLESQGSSFAGRRYRLLYLDAVANRGGMIDVDTLLVAWGSGTPALSAPAPSPIIPDFMTRDIKTLLRAPLYLSEEDRRIFSAGPSLGIGGLFDMRTPDLPRYDFSARGRNVNLEDILLDPESRTRLSFTLSMEGSGTDPDEIQGKGRLAVEASDYAGTPIPEVIADFNLERRADNRRILDLTSSLADINLQGRWRFSTIMPGLMDAVNGFTGYVTRKARQSTPTTAATSLSEPIDANFTADIKDLSPLRPILKGQTLEATGLIDGRVYGTPRQLNINSNGTIDLLMGLDSATSLRLSQMTFGLNVRNITPGGGSDAMSGNIVVKSDTTLSYGDLLFKKPDLSVDFQGGQFHVVGRTFIDTTMFVAVDGMVDARDVSAYKVAVDTLFFTMGRDMAWRNAGQIRAEIGDGTIMIDSLAMQRNKGEIVTAHGMMAGERFEDLRLSVLGGSIRGIGELIQGTDSYSTIEPMEGILRQAEVVLNGTLDAPIFTAVVAVDSLSYSGNPIGNLRTDLSYADRNLQGTIHVRNLLGTADTARLPADIRIESLPVDLALASREERLVTGGPVKISVVTNNLPIAFAGPFIPAARVRKGRANIDFAVEGNYPDLTYQGNGLIEAQAILDANNILYYIRLPLDFHDQVLAIEDAILKNDPRDLPGGTATVDARITFSGLELEEIDATIATPQLLVLSEASAAVNEFVYGDLVIATGARPLRFSGSLSDPQLSADIDVLRGDIRLPSDQNEYTENPQPVLYIGAEDWEALQNTEVGPTMVKIDTTGIVPPAAVDSASLAGASEQAVQVLDRVGGEMLQQPSIVDLLDLDLNINIKGRLFLRMDLGGLTQQLRAEIGGREEGLTIHRTDGETSIRGTLEAKPGSKFIYIKTFDATGEISFQNDISNPTINIDAQYFGRRLQLGSNESEEYTVDIAITGTKERPVIQFSYTLNGVAQSVGDPDQQTRNAVSLLLFGRTTEELRGTGLGTQFGSLAGSFSGAYASALTSTLLSSALANSGFIQSVDIDVSGFNGIRLNFVSQFGPVVLRYGGDISSPTEGTITVDLPMTALLDAEFFRNFALQLQRAVDDAGTTSSSGTQRETYRIRLQFRDSW